MKRRGKSEGLWTRPSVRGPMSRALTCQPPLWPNEQAAHLPTPADLLVKNPKLIADPVAIGG